MSETTEPTARKWFRGPLRPFRHGQYRLLTGSLTASLFAEGFWLIAMVWQVVALGGKATDLSLVATATAIGMVATTLFGGVLADRIPQRRILLTTELILTSSMAVVAVLALSGQVAVWQLAVVGLIRGLGAGFYYPAYTAMLPSIVPANELLAVNGIEGMLRPTVMQALGPAVAGLVVAARSPATAIAVAVGSQAVAALFLVGMRQVPLRRDLSEDPDRHPAKAMAIDLRDGFIYMLRTPWLLATLVFASVMMLVVMGPMEVLTPFVIKDRAGGGPKDHALMMAAFGVSGALSSLVWASRKLPRRYLTVMNLTWGVACLPFIVIGIAHNVWVIVVAAFIVGALFNGPMVIWGTLLQRRVPPALLGRVSSLDFFVSLIFMPISLALAGPVSDTIGLERTFLIAGLVPVALAVLTIVLAKMPADELAHPLDVPAEDDSAQSGPPSDETESSKPLR